VIKLNKTHSEDCFCIGCIANGEWALRIEKIQENKVINQDKKELKVAVKELHAYMNGDEPMIKLSFDLINKNGEKMSVVREVKTAMLVGNIASHINELAQLIVDSNDLY